MIGLADIYVWVVDNKWWLAGLVPFIIVIVLVRSASVK